MAKRIVGIIMSCGTNRVFRRIGVLLKGLTLTALCLSSLTLAQLSESAYNAPVSAPKSKETVAVYIAGKENKESEGMHSILGGELVRAISTSDRYTAVDRTAQVLAALDKEYKHQEEGAVRYEDIIEFGRQFAAKYLCIAEVTSVRGGRYYINVRLVDTETAEAKAPVTETSTLEDTKEMRRVAQLLASQLVGKESEVAALAAAAPNESFEPAPAPITAADRQKKREETERAAPSEYNSTYNPSYTIIERSPIYTTDDDTQTAASARPTSSRKFESGGRDKEIRYGGRLAFSSLFAGEQSNSGGDWLESQSSGEFFSLGLTMNIPVVSIISLNPELAIDIRRMDLSVTQQDGEQYGNDAMMEYVLSLPLTVRFEISHFYAETGLRFDYPLMSDFDFAGDEREQIDMGGIVGVGFTFKFSSVKCYAGYRFEGNITDFDEKEYFRFYRNSIGVMLLF